MAIIGTPITPIPSTGSYVTVEELDSFFASNPDPEATAFLALNDTEKIWYIRKATALIDSHDFQGFKYISTQELEFPRKFYPSGSESPWGITLSIDLYGYVYQSAVPQEILDACCLEAFALYQDVSSGGSTEQELMDAGVTSFTLGRLSMSFGAGGGSGSMYMKSRKAFHIIEKFIEKSSFLI